jgi:O-antigen ligase
MMVLFYYLFQGNLKQRLVVIFFTVFGIIFFNSIIELITKIVGNYKYNDFGGLSSVIDRFSLQIRAIDLFIQNPFFGYGVNSMYPLAVSEKLPWIITNYFNGGEELDYFINLIVTGEHVSNTHNLYIEMLFNLGLFGLLVFYFLFIYPIRMLFLIKRKDVFFLLILIFGFSIYYMFQAVPDEFFIFFSLLTVIEKHRINQTI